MSVHSRFPRRTGAKSPVDPAFDPAFRPAADSAQHRERRADDERPARAGAGRGFGPPWARFARDDSDEDAGAGEAVRGRRRPRPGPGGWSGPWGPGFGGGPGGPGGPAGRGGRARRNRGDVRTAILWLLAERPMHGYELITEVESASGGSWRPSPGAIYPTLSMLADEGLVTTDADIAASAAGGRKVFELTEAGRVEAASLRAGEPPWGEVSAVDNIGESAKALGAAVWQIARTGTTEERAAAKAVIDKAKRDLYRILAGDLPLPVPSGGETGESS